MNKTLAMLTISAMIAAAAPATDASLLDAPRSDACSTQQVCINDGDDEHCLSTGLLCLEIFDNYNNGAHYALAEVAANNAGQNMSQPAPILFVIDIYELASEYTMPCLRMVGAGSSGVPTFSQCSIIPEATLVQEGVANYTMQRCDSGVSTNGVVHANGCKSGLIGVKFGDPYVVLSVGETQLVQQRTAQELVALIECSSLPGGSDQRGDLACIV